jgi:hypothetical protein
MENGSGTRVIGGYTCYKVAIKAASVTDFRNFRPKKKKKRC